MLVDNNVVRGIKRGPSLELLHSHKRHKLDLPHEVLSGRSQEKATGVVRFL